MVAQEGGKGDSGDRTAAFRELGEIAAEIAHELGNVLGVVAGSMYVARHAVLQGDAAGSVPHLDKAERATRLAQSLVTDVMALARGDALHAQPVPVVDLVALARRDIPPPGARWVDVVEPADLCVRAHPNLFARLLHAIYDNAVRASAPRVPTVTTRASAGSGVVVIDVTDDGPGVPSEIAARIFEPLVTARPGGTGLGLALASRIARAHGGWIALLPTDVGAGFRVELPR
jgi:signal transduction histidine kinase